MDEDEPPEEPEKPRYLLPDGCKDLIDALRLQEKNQEVDPDAEIAIGDETLTYDLPTSIEIPEYIIIKDLATALRTPGFRILHVLMNFGIFEKINNKIDFKTASIVCTHYGVTPHKIP